MVGDKKKKPECFMDHIFLHLGQTDPIEAALTSALLHKSVLRSFGVSQCDNICGSK